MVRPLPKQHGIAALILAGLLQSLWSKAPKVHAVLDRITHGAGAMQAGATGTPLLERMFRASHEDMAEDLLPLQHVNTVRLMLIFGTVVAAKK